MPIAALQGAKDWITLEEVDPPNATVHKSHCSEQVWLNGEKEIQPSAQIMTLQKPMTIHLVIEARAIETVRLMETVLWVKRAEVRNALAQTPQWTVEALLRPHVRAEVC